MLSIYSIQTIWLVILSPCLLTSTTYGKFSETLLHHNTGSISAFVVGVAVVILLHQLAMMVVVSQGERLNILVLGIERKLLHGEMIQRHVLVLATTCHVSLVHVSAPSRHHGTWHQHQILQSKICHQSIFTVLTKTPASGSVTFMPTSCQFNHYGWSDHYTFH